MSTSRDSCCLPSVKKQKHDFQVFAFSVRVISLSLRLRLIILTSTLIILDITKTSSNNCLLLLNALELLTAKLRRLAIIYRAARAIKLAPVSSGSWHQPSTGLRGESHFSTPKQPDSCFSRFPFGRKRTCLTY